MDSKKGSNKDENFGSNYEETSGDSDIESRLYAEIHYSNNVIGDESSVQSESNNSFGNTSTRKHSAIPNIQSQGNLQTSHPSNALSTEKVPIASAQSNTGVSTITNSANENPVQSQSNSNANSKKRPVPTDSQEGESKRRKKKQTKTDNVNDRNRIINPYHKDVVNNQQYGMKLLSPAFLHLFFGKSKGKKKKNKKVNAPAEPSKVSISHETSAPNTSQESDVQKSIENEVIQKEAEVSVAQNSETIIDICSDSSQDSVEDNSKYNNIEATDKKLTKQNSVVSNENSDDDTSDSDESIFEVPIPPKPTPPVIDLNDSDNENQELSDDSDSSASSQDSRQGNSDSMNRSVSNISENLQEQENSDSESSEGSNLILNCTEIQKGASSISEIKRMSSEISSKTSTVNETNTTNASDNSKNDSEVPGNAVSRENTVSSVKKLNSSVTKQISKSSQKQGNRDSPREESFFQPMSDKMKSFYNDSWGGENFDMETLKTKMTRDPKKWAILDDDLVVTFSRRKRYFGMVCSRCQKEGHRQNQCPVPYKPPSCHMCGKQGHLENNCPDKKCLTCGRKQNSYRKTCEQCVRMVCSRCKARGHMEHFCPDLWRSYHQTVNNTKPKVPKNVKTVMKPQHSLYCCNCAKKGHDSQNCRKLRWSEHFPVPSHVISYDGPEYSKENVGTESNLNNSNSCGDNTFTPSNASDRSMSRNLAHDKPSRFSKNQTLVADKNVIFQIKSKIPNQSEALIKVKLTLEIPNKNVPDEYNYWTKLSTFLDELMNEIPGEFLLYQNNQKVVMDMRLPRTPKILLKTLIQQYAGRNNFERSHMYLKCDRNPNHMREHLSTKFNEINNMTFPKSILELYDEVVSLKSQQQASTFQKQKLMICQKELLAALYRENCANNSLLILKKLLTVKAKSLRKVKVLLEYLIHYNNVFVPHEPQQLNKYISNYKAGQSRRERLRNNPLIMEPRGNSATGKSTAQRKSFSSTVTTESVLTASSSTSCQIPNLLLINTSTVSQIQPIVSQVQPAASQMQPAASQIQPSVSHIQPAVSQLEPTIPSDAAGPLLSINTSISSNIQFSQNSPTVANVKRKSSRKSRKDSNYKSFLKKTTKLIEDAHKLNKPHVRKYAEILENKIKNGIFLFTKDAATLRALISRNSR